MLILLALFGVIPVVTKPPDENKCDVTVSLPFMLVSVLFMISFFCNILLIYRNYKCRECEGENRKSLENSEVVVLGPQFDKVVKSPLVECVEKPRMNHFSPPTHHFPSEATLDFITPSNALIEGSMPTPTNLLNSPVSLATKSLNHESTLKVEEINEVTDGKKTDWKEFNVEKLLKIIDTFENGGDLINGTAQCPNITLSDTSAGFFYLLADSYGNDPKAIALMYGRKYRNDVNRRNLKKGAILYGLLESNDCGLLSAAMGFVLASAIEVSENYGERELSMREGINLPQKITFARTGNKVDADDRVKNRSIVSRMFGCLEDRMISAFSEGFANTTQTLIDVGAQNITFLTEIGNNAPNYAIFNAKKRDLRRRGKFGKRRHFIPA